MPSIALLLALATPARADTADDAVREALAKQEGDVYSSEVLRSP